MTPMELLAWGAAGSGVALMVIAAIFVLCSAIKALDRQDRTPACHACGRPTVPTGGCKFKDIYKDLKTPPGSRWVCWRHNLPVYYDGPDATKPASARHPMED